MFSKDSCPICFGPTRWTNNVFYVCEIKHHHTYKMDPVIDSYFIKFENPRIADIETAINF